MKKILMILAASMVAVPTLAQTPAPAQAPGNAQSTIRVSGDVTTGLQAVDNSSNSSKLTEYRDLRDDFLLPSFSLSVADTATGTAFAVRAVYASRSDQTIDASRGRPGAWNVFAHWNAIPHNYSNKALSPYIERSPGVFGVPATFAIQSITNPAQCPKQP